MAEIIRETSGQFMNLTTEDFEGGAGNGTLLSDGEPDLVNFKKSIGVANKVYLVLKVTSPVKLTLSLNPIRKIHKNDSREFGATGLSAPLLEETSFDHDYGFTKDLIVVEVSDAVTISVPTPLYNLGIVVDDHTNVEQLNITAQR